jgi:hypothetical protein
MPGSFSLFTRRYILGRVECALDYSYMFNHAEIVPRVKHARL